MGSIISIQEINNCKEFRKFITQFIEISTKGHWESKNVIPVEIVFIWIRFDVKMTTHYVVNFSETTSCVSCF